MDTTTDTDTTTTDTTPGARWVALRRVQTDADADTFDRETAASIDAAVSAAEAELAAAEAELAACLAASSYQGGALASVRYAQSSLDYARTRARWDYVASYPVHATLRLTSARGVPYPAALRPGEAGIWVCADGGDDQPAAVDAACGGVSVRVGRAPSWPDPAGPDGRFRVLTGGFRIVNGWDDPAMVHLVGPCGPVPAARLARDPDLRAAIVAAGWSDPDAFADGRFVGR